MKYKRFDKNTAVSLFKRLLSAAAISLKLHRWFSTLLNRLYALRLECVLGSITLETGSLKQFFKTGLKRTKNKRHFSIGNRPQFNICKGA